MDFMGATRRRYTTRTITEPRAQGGATLGRLVARVDDGTLGAAQARKVLSVLLTEGGDPDTIIAREGLAKVSDPAQIGAWADAVIARFPAEVARYQAGQKNLVGFFVGKVLAESGGRADAGATQRVVGQKLG